MQYTYNAMPLFSPRLHSLSLLCPPHPVPDRAGGVFLSHIFRGYEVKVTPSGHAKINSRPSTGPGRPARPFAVWSPGGRGARRARGGAWVWRVSQKEPAAPPRAPSHRASEKKGAENEGSSASARGALVLALPLGERCERGRVA